MPKISLKILLFLLLLLFIVIVLLFLPRFSSIQNEDVNKNTLKPQIKILPKESSSNPMRASPQPPKQNNTPTPPFITTITTENSLKVPILFYHYVGNNPNPQDLQRDVLSITPDKFEEQMKYLKEREFTTISLDTLYAALKKQITLPDKSIVLTFDDGYIDFYHNAYPILLKFKLSATVFIPTGLANSSYYLTWPQIKEMQNSGLINYGSHTVHHYNLPSIPENTAFNELSESKKVLQDNLGVPINFISYPNGATNNFIVNLAQKAGYVGGVGTWANSYQSEETIYNMPRLRISGSLSLDNFAKLLQ